MCRQIGDEKYSGAGCEMIVCVIRAHALSHINGQIFHHPNGKPFFMISHQWADRPIPSHYSISVCIQYSTCPLEFVIQSA